ncbi:MAG: efflux RND transporter periplasmic adaptor subunit [Alphaproteobacteria bacterium]|nr:efflux RND transporter periplasmic adaptor subunit [Alphaproteobacteria bacterium]
MKRAVRHALLLGLLGCQGPVSGPVAPPEAPHDDDHDDHDGDDHGDRVVLGARARDNARLVVRPLVVEPLAAAVRLPARVVLDPRREARVSAVTGGVVDGLAVRPGDRVRAGQALATILSPELAEAFGRHLSASVRRDVARERRDRLRTLVDGGFSSEAEAADAEATWLTAVADAEAAEERLLAFGVAPSDLRPAAGSHFASRLALRSPIDGEVLAVDAALGASVSHDQRLVHVGDLDTVWLLVEVYERHLAGVRPGASVRFTTEAWGEETFEGVVDAVGGWLDPDSRTMEVRVIVDNADHRLKPNMFAEAELALQGAAQRTGLVIAETAVQPVEGRPSVFVQVDDATFEARAVRTAPLGGGRVELVEGVRPGEPVVVDGAFTLRSELERASLGHGHAH